MTFTTKGHGPIEGSYYGPRHELMMVTEYRELKAVPKRYELIDTTTDLTKYTASFTKKVKVRSNTRIFFDQLIKNLNAGYICRVGAHVITFDSGLKQYEIFHKVKMV